VHRLRIQVIASRRGQKSLGRSGMDGLPSGRVRAPKTSAIIVYYEHISVSDGKTRSAYDI
jgi:hypothetical protein